MQNADVDNRQRLFDLIRQAQENSGKQDSDELLALALEAQTAVRREDSDTNRDL